MLIFLTQVNTIRSHRIVKRCEYKKAKLQQDKNSGTKKSLFTETLDHSTQHETHSTYKYGYKILKICNK